MAAKVEIYTRDWCGYCSRAKDLLERKGIDFTEIKAGSDARLKDEMVRRSNGGQTFPQIFIDGRPVGGCDDMVALDARGELNGLLGVEA